MNLFKVTITQLILLLILAPDIHGQGNQISDSLNIKFNPGHYVAIEPFFELADINHLDEPALRGVNKRFAWRTLEKEKGEYDFSYIQQDLDFCAKHNKQFIVFIADKSFWIKGALPSYLKEYELNSKNGGFRTLRWFPEYVERFSELGKAIGEKFDSHPNFEGVAIQETSLDMSKEELQKYNYTPEKYRDALITLLKGLAQAMPQSQIFWYQNWLAENKGHLREIAHTIIGSNVIMGGPDILPHRRWLRHTYKIYPELKDRLNLFCSAQDDSYKHHKNDIRWSNKLPVHEEGYLTMEEIFLYGRDSMHLKYLFWNYY